MAPRGDAVQTQPTTEDQMSKFQTYATKDGEVSDGAQTDDEAAVLAAREADDKTRKDNAAAEAETARAEKAAKSPEEKLIEQAAARQSAKDALKIVDGDDTKTMTVAEAKKMAKEAADTAGSKRIGQAVKAQRTAERERDSVLARITALEQKGTGLTPAATTVNNNSNAEPDPAKYDLGELDKRYIKDLAAYETRKALNEAKASQQQETLSAQQLANREKFIAAKDVLTEKGAEKYDDFDEVVVQGANSDEYKLSQTMGELCLESDVGHDVLYALASDPKEAARVFGLSPAKQAAYFGRLEAKFLTSASDATTQDQTADATAKKPAAEAGKTTVKVTQALQAPLNGARGAGSKQGTSASTSSFSDFEAMAMGRK